MSGLKGSSDFLFLSEPQLNIEGNILSQGEKTHKLLWGQSFSLMLYLPGNSKIEDENCKKSCCSSFGVGEFWSTANDTFSSNLKTCLRWEV